MSKEELHSILDELQQIITEFRIPPAIFIHPKDAKRIAKWYQTKQMVKRMRKINKS